ALPLSVYRGPAPPSTKTPGALLGALLLETGDVRLDRLGCFLETYPRLLAVEQRRLEFLLRVLGQPLHLIGERHRLLGLFVTDPQAPQEDVHLLLQAAQPGLVRRPEEAVRGAAAREKHHDHRDHAEIEELQHRE